MFVNTLLRNNRALLDSSFTLLRDKLIQPDTYVIDVDCLRQNAAHIQHTAVNHGIELYYMTKQFGRNPYIASELDKIGYAGAVAVDWREALALHSGGARIAHLGHLVQPPASMLQQLLALLPDVITVYSLDMARAINAAAEAIGRRQKLLLKIIEAGDVVYPGQEGGISLSQATKTAECINSLSNVVVEGITAFPCFLFDGADAIAPTNNMHTLIAAASVLRANGIPINQINTPSANCSAMLALMAQMGSTHAEPGHALMGTTPLHAVREQPERVAMLYMSEVSHNHLDKAYCFGGGYYRRGNMQQAVIDDGGSYKKVSTGIVNAEAIDYYLQLHTHAPIGTPVALCFRTQVFVTRSQVAVVEGISAGAPRIVGIYDAQGVKLR